MQKLTLTECFDTFWIDSPGNRERIENLLWAQTHCDGMFRAVVIIAEDPHAMPRRISDCYPQLRWNMRIMDLDDRTGLFRAEHVAI